MILGSLSTSGGGPKLEVSISKIPFEALPGVAESKVALTELTAACVTRVFQLESSTKI